MCNVKTMLLKQWRPKGREDQDYYSTYNFTTEVSFSM